MRLIQWCVHDVVLRLRAIGDPAFTKITEAVRVAIQGVRPVQVSWSVLTKSAGLTIQAVPAGAHEIVVTLVKEDEPGFESPIHRCRIVLQGTPRSVQLTRVGLGTCMITNGQ